MSVTIIFLSLFVLVILIYLLLRVYVNQKYYHPVLLDFEVKGGHYGNADHGHIVDPKYQKTGVKLPFNNRKKTKMPEFSDRLEFSYLISIFIENNFETNDKDDRCIITRNDSPGFYYRPQTNDFVIRIRHSKNTQDELVVSGLIDQQSWMTIVCVFKNRDLEVYKNGKLHTSIEIENVPQPDMANLTLYPNYGIYAKTSYIHYFNKALQPWKIPLLSSKTCPFFWWLFI